jgi:hypothetical protein
MMIRFTYCKNFASAETKEVEWDDFVRPLMRSVEFPSKEASVKRGAFIGGVREDESRGREDNIKLRTVVTIDYDALTVPIEDVEFSLEMSLSCAHVAYSTFRHTPSAPRVRLCIPLSRPVNEAEYRLIVDEVVKTVGLGEPDACSYVMNQLMFLPSHQPGVEPWSRRNNGEAWEVSSVLSVPSVPEAASETDGTDGTDGFDETDDIDRLLISRPLDLTDEQVDATLESYAADGLEYDDWARVGMALYHQFEGSDAGWKRWLAWSEKSSKHDSRQMRVKWRSFDAGRRNRPVTFASVIKLAGGLRNAVEIRPSSRSFTDLLQRAESVSSMAEYQALRKDVRRLDDMRLPKDMRSIIVATVHEVWGKDAKIDKRGMASAFKAAGGARPLDGDDEGPPRPDWAKDWVFCQSDDTFERMSVPLSSSAHGFRLSYAGEREVIEAELDAVTYVTRFRLVEIVASKMYWPGAGKLFDTDDGLRRLNTYFDSGVTPCDSLEGDLDGRAVVEMFLQHVRKTIRGEREQRIVLDFMSYVIQNPGKRINWALLIHGIEGNGKSYFFVVMQYAMGVNARVVSTTAIDSQFTGWAEGATLIGVEEIRIAGTNKYGILDKMKPLITNDTIAVVHKGRDEKAIPNFASYMMMTNHADAIPVGDNDRRYCVISTQHTRKEDLLEQHGGANGVSAYFEKLFSETARRSDAIVRFLMDWKQSDDFKPRGRAPETDGLMAMRSMHVSEERDVVEGAIEKYACSVIGPDLIDVTELRRQALIDGETLPAGRALTHILSDLGYSPIPSRRVRLKDRTNHYIWFRAGRVAHHEAVEIVRRGAETPVGFDDPPF